jgi:hypothetical protein
MPNTPNYGWPYPASSAVPGLMWKFLEDLAKAIDTQLASIEATLTAAVTPLPLGVIARGRRGSDNTSITTEQGILRLDDVPIVAGRLYRVSAQFSVNNQTVRVIPNLRYTTDGSTPSTSSTLLEEAVFNSTAVSTTGGTARVVGYYTPGSNQTFSVLLTAQSSGVAVTVFGANDEHCDLVIEDCGVDPGDTGSDV